MKKQTKAQKKQQAKKEKAIEFVNSMRGQYIISQALCLAVEEMSKVKSPHTELSNIADMNYMINNVFPICKTFEWTEKDVKKLKERIKNGTKECCDLNHKKGVKDEL